MLEVPAQTYVYISTYVAYSSKYGKERGKEEQRDMDTQ